MTLLVPDSWSPQQALAVFELLDDLREVIATRYGADLHSALHEQRESCRDPRQTNLPFGLADYVDILLALGRRPPLAREGQGFLQRLKR